MNHKRNYLGAYGYCSPYMGTLGPKYTHMATWTLRELFKPLRKAGRAGLRLLDAGFVQGSGFFVVLTGSGVGGIRLSIGGYEGFMGHYKGGNPSTPNQGRVNTR